MAERVPLVEAAVELLAQRDAVHSPHAWRDEDDRADYLKVCRTLNRAIKADAMGRLIAGGLVDEVELAGEVDWRLGPGDGDLVCPWCGRLLGHRYGLCPYRVSAGDQRDLARAHDGSHGLYVVHAYDAARLPAAWLELRITDR